MILHIFEDNKFIDYAIKQFGTIAPNLNRFVLLVPYKNYTCKSVKNFQEVDIIVNNSVDFQLLCNDLYKYKAIITHNFQSKFQVAIISRAPDNVKKAWVFWGAEFYSRQKYIRKFLGKYSFILYNKHQLKMKFKSLISVIKTGKKFVQRYESPVETFRKIDFCLTDVIEDYEVVRETLKCDFQYSWYNYYSIEETLGKLKNELINGNNILLGNSATMYNNHFEALKILREFELGNRKLITPLSYGDIWYKNIILAKGSRNFGEHFYPLTDFLDREEYNKIVLSCSVTIMNHYRQQAMGNIITALWLGSKVYLNKLTTTYLYLKRIGIHVYSIEDDLNPKNKETLENLSHDKIMHNREILSREYSKNNVLEKVNQLVKILCT